MCSRYCGCVSNFIMAHQHREKAIPVNQYKNYKEGKEERRKISNNDKKVRKIIIQDHNL